MDYKLRDLIDIPKFHELLGSLNDIFAFASAIRDNEGNILATSGWQDVCAKFHRVNPDTEKQCRESSLYILSHLHEARPSVIYKCPQGLVDTATPIIIDGKHIGSVLVGQFFLEEPDLEFFRMRARKYGFDEDAYIEAVSKVPVLIKDQLERNLAVIAKFSEVLAETGLRRMREMEASAKLSESEEYFRSLIENSADMIVVLDADNIVRYRSPSAERLLGYKHDEVVGTKRGVIVITHPDDLALVKNIAETAKHNPGVAVGPVEVRRQHKDGSWRWFELVNTALTQKSGQTLLVLNSRDITERKRMEELLRKEKESFFSIMDNNPHGIALIGYNGRYLYVNPEFTKITGYTLEDIPTGRDWFEKAYPDPEYRKKAKDSWKLYRKQEGRGTDVEFRIACKDGQYKDIEFRVTYLEDRILLVLTDITSRKKAEEALRENEEKYRGIFENSVVGIFQSTPKRRFIAVNPALAHIHGFASPEEMMAEITDIGEQLYVNREDRQSYVDLIRKEGMVKNFEVQQYRKDRSKIWVSLNIRAIWDTEGKLLYNQGIVEDITSRKQAEEALRESEERFRLVFNNIADGILLTAPEGIILAANDAACRMHGRTEEELRQVGRAGIVDLSDPLLAASLERRQRTGKTRIEHYQVRKDGTKFLCEVVSNMFIDKNGRQRAVTILREVTEQRRMEEALRESEKRLQAIMDASPVAIMWGDMQGNLEYVNRKFTELFGYTLDDIPTVADWRRLAYPDQVYSERAMSLHAALTEEKKQGTEVVLPTEVIITCKDGSTRYVKRMGVLVSKRVLGMYTDLTERKLAEDELRRKTAFLEALMNSSPDGILVVDNQKQVVLQNQRYTDVRKLPQHIVDQKDDEIRLRYIIGTLKHPEEFLKRVAYLYAHPNETGRDEIEAKDGTVLERYSSPVLDKDGTYYGRIWTFRDITELKLYQSFLENLSTTDGLTGIANRRRFDEFLEREWHRSIRNHTPLSIIFMDIDFFKAFNDHYGHLAGDDCLRQLAQSLAECVRRPVDLAARYGGEEFVCLLPDADDDGAMLVAHQIQEKMNSLNIPHTYSSVAGHVTLSMGVATMIPALGEPFSDLIRRADELMYAAKQDGRNQIRN